jgi:hypothetical protein
MSKTSSFVVMLITSLTLFFPCMSSAVELSTGSTIYVPMYRTFYNIYGSSKDAYGLTITACLRNTDPKQVIVISAIDHYDSDGKLVKKFVSEPITLKPWSSTELSIPPGGTEDYGANLIVRWKSEQPANPPLAEAMMVGQMMNRGISFNTLGIEIKE